MMRRSFIVKRIGLVGLIGATAAFVVILIAGPSSRDAHSYATAFVSAPVTTDSESSIVKEYASLQQLRQDATSVAVLAPTAVTRVEAIVGVPFTLTDVEVVQTISGVALPATLELRQTGDGSDPQASLVSHTKAYLAYLQPFELPHGVPIPGEYVVIGDLQGLYEQVCGHGAVSGPNAAASATFARADQDATALPASVTVQQAATS